MPNNITTRIAFAVMSMLLPPVVLGCGVSPEKACDAQAALWKADGKIIQDTEGRKKDCVRELEAMKARNPDEYKCSADCDVHASDANGMMNCHQSCARQYMKK